MYKKSTPEAETLRYALEKLGIRVLTELHDGRKSIDLAIPDARINIEVDGRQHFTKPDQILSDLERMHHSVHLGYDTIHIPNEFINSDLERIAGALARAAKIRKDRGY
jgi:very-short-patch-repair endonuclease